MQFLKVTFALIFLISVNAFAQKNETNSLLDPLTFNNSQKVKTTKEWPVRRKEILETITQEIYGTSPERPGNMRFEVFDNDKNALGGKGNAQTGYCSH